MQLFDFFDARILANPFPVYRQLRAVAGVHHLESVGVHLVVSYDSAERVLRDAVTFSSQEALTGWVLRDDSRNPPVEIDFQASVPGVSVLLGADNPDHDRLRRVVAPAFTRDAVTRMEARIGTVAEAIVDDLREQSAGGATVDLVADFAERLPAETIGLLLGLPAAFTAEITAWARAITRSWGPPDPQGPAALPPSAVRGWDMLRHLHELIVWRRSRPGDGLLDDLLAARAAHPGAISDSELIGMVGLLVLAGYETTACCIGSLLHHLVDDADLMGALRAEPALLGPAFDETVRLDAPIQATWRSPLADTSLDGVRIPKNSKVMVVVGSANRDERIFDDAEQFRLDRPVRRHLGFGIGLHYCIGALLARAEVNVGVGCLLRRAKELDGQPGLEFTRKLMLRGVYRLPVVATID